MSGQDAVAIAQWHYSEPYTFYDLKSDRNDYEEFLNLAKWKRDSKFSVIDDHGELVGLFEFSYQNDVVDIGLGVRPDLTGRGIGLSFFLAGLKFASEKFSPKRFKLSVAAFNTRAIKVYEKAGFRIVRTFWNETNGGVYKFLEMSYEPF